MVIEAVVRAIGRRHGKHRKDFVATSSAALRRLVVGNRWREPAQEPLLRNDHHKESGSGG
jgi:hypothetical protein